MSERPGARAALLAAYRRSAIRHARSPGEATLRDAYELGRTAITVGVSALDIARAHHDAVRRLVPAAGGADESLEHAADFLVEALTPFEIVRRGFVEVAEAEKDQREQAAILRRLSSILSDASLSVDTPDSIPEMLQLVVEDVRELTGAARVAARVGLPSERSRLDAVAEDEQAGEDAGPPDEVLPLVSLDGSRLGTIELSRPRARPLSRLDLAVAEHVAEMCSAALDRARRYRP